MAGDRKGRIHLSTALGPVLAAATYFFLAKAGLTFATINSLSSPIWPATGFAFALLAKFGLSWWPAITVGAFAANFAASGQLSTAALIAIGNGLEALCGAYLIRNGSRSLKSLVDTQAETIAILGASVLATVASATIGVCSLKLLAGLPSEQILPTWFTWWIGDVLGGIATTPMFLALLRTNLRVPTWAETGRVVAALGLLLLAFSVVAFAVFQTPATATMFFLYPLLLLGVYLLPRSGAYVMVIAAIVGGTVWSIVSTGPFEAASINDRLIHVQFFVFTYALTASSLTSMAANTSLKFASRFLFAGWIASAMIFMAFMNDVAMREGKRFESIAAQEQQRIVNRLANYEEALRGAVSYYSVAQHFDANDWRQYVIGLGLLERYPGVNGMGVVFSVPFEKAWEHEQKMRAEGLENYTIRPVPGHAFGDDGSAHEHFSISYIEPLATNSPALGLDLASEKNRRDAAIAARDSGNPTVTEAVTLVQDNKKGPGFLFYLPIYKKGATAHSVESRREAHVGWVYAPFIAEKLFSDLLAHRSDLFHLKVFSGPRPEEEKLIYALSSTGSRERSGNGRTSCDPLSFAGKTFCLAWSPGPLYITEQHTTPSWVASGCALIALLITMLLENFRRTREDAERIVTTRTAELETANEAAQAATKAKSEFLAVMSHEIRTPLNGILGMSEVALGANPSPQQREFLNIIHRSATNLLALLTDILDLSRIEAKKLRLESIDFDIVPLLQDVEASIASTITQKGLQYISESVPMDRYFSGDPLRIRQILYNVLGNAAKFTDAGSITLRAASERLGNKQRRLSFEVEDTGPGIPAHRIPHLFQEFEQSDSSTTRRYGGSGLGLAICRHLCQMMDGHISVASEEGKGSNFSFHIIVHDPVGMAPVLQSEGVPVRDLSGVKVLVAEDNPVNQLVCKRMLESSGAIVETVSDGEQAVAAFEARSFDIILMDCQMPVMDGYSASRKIRGLAHRNRQIPIVAVTASVIPGERERCQDAGMTGFLTKPYRSQDLLDTMAVELNTRPVTRRTVSQDSSSKTVNDSFSSVAFAQAMDNDAPLMLEVAEIFQGTVLGIVVELEQSLVNDDRKQIAFHAHKLKSSTAFFGDDAIRKMLVTLEGAKDGGDLAELKNIGDEVILRIKKLRSEVGHWVETHKKRA